MITFIDEQGESNFEIETDKIKILGSCNNVDKALIVNQDKSYSKDLRLSTDAVISFKKTIKILKEQYLLPFLPGQT